MITGAGAAGRGPATEDFCTRTDVTPAAAVRDATDSAGLTVALTGRLTVAVLWEVEPFRCLRLGGTVPVKPIAAKRWRAKMSAMIRGAEAKDELNIRMLSFHLIGEKRGGLLARAVLQRSTGAAE
jgi:hypothetical protein